MYWKRYSVAYTNEDFWKELRFEQLHEAVEDVAPTLAQDVAVTMRQTKHGSRRQLRFRVRPEVEHDLLGRLRKFER